MKRTTDWNGDPIELAETAGGTLAFTDPLRGVLRGGVSPWPPPELVPRRIGDTELMVRETTWADLCFLWPHIALGELGHYYGWKLRNSRQCRAKAAA